MIFKSIHIQNYRNYDDVEIDLSNRNVFIGQNDVGKSNLINAIRLVLDREIRKNNCVETDFHLRNTSEPIIITLAIDISDSDATDTEKLRAKMKGVSLSSEEILYIRLTATYNNIDQIAVPVLDWGGDIDNLFPMNGINAFYDIDKVFNILYIDSSIDMNRIFKKNTKKLITTSDDDAALLNQINDIVQSLNDTIGNISGIKKFQDDITACLQQYRDKDLQVSIKSEIAVKGLFDNIVPYIQKTGDDNLYPTAGDGRRKLLAYSILEILSKQNQDAKINVFLIEEPENHLHKSLQIALSKILFCNGGFPYVFIATHSPFILMEMEDVQIIRIYNDNHIFGKSDYYKISSEYQDIKLILNNQLSEAIFANKVLLVEGQSEKILFSYIANKLKINFEAKGAYILVVDGIKFPKYYQFLKAIGIKVIIRTDNDLRKRSDGKYSVLGFCRCNGYLDYKKLPEDPIDNNSVAAKRELYKNNNDLINEIADNYSIYISHCDLENDLDEIMHDKLVEYLGDDPVQYLQSNKVYNMSELIKHLTLTDCQTIYSNPLFTCLKEIF